MSDLTLFKTLQIRQKSREASSRQRNRLPCFIGVSLTDPITFPLTAKVFKYGVISGPYLPAFGLNTERYFGFLGIQSECGEIRTRNNSVFGLFSCSVHATVLSLSSLTLAYCKWKKWFAWAVAAGKCKKNLYRKKCRTQLGRNHSRLFNKIVSLKNSKKKTGMNFAKFLRTFFLKKKKEASGYGICQYFYHNITPPYSNNKTKHLILFASYLWSQDYSTENKLPLYKLNN